MPIQIQAAYKSTRLSARRSLDDRPWQFHTTFTIATHQTLPVKPTISTRKKKPSALHSTRRCCYILRFVHPETKKYEPVIYPFPFSPPSPARPHDNNNNPGWCWGFEIAGQGVRERKNNKGERRKRRERKEVKSTENWYFRPSQPQPQQHTTTPLRNTNHSTK